MAVDPLAPFSPAVRAWFESSFPEATPPQAQGWPAIAGGDHTLILAPTGSGKTLSAFLWAIDELGLRDQQIDRTASLAERLRHGQRSVRRPLPAHLDGRHDSTLG